MRSHSSFDQNKLTLVAGCMYFIKLYSHIRSTEPLYMYYLKKEKEKKKKKK